MTSYTESFGDVNNWGLWNGDAFTAESGVARLAEDTNFVVCVAIQDTTSLGSDEQWIKFQTKDRDNQGIGFCLRAPSTSGNHYQWRHKTSDDTWRLEEAQGDGTFVEAVTGSSGAQTYADETYYGIHISDDGSDITIEFWKFTTSDPGDDPAADWGAADETVTSSGVRTNAIITGNNYVGLRAYSAGTADNDSPAYVEFDNFFATGPAAGGGFVPYPNPRYGMTGGMQPMSGGMQ